MASADEIRAFAKSRYVEPAFETGAHMLTLRAGDVHTVMRLTSRVPAVCSALKSKKFEALCGIQLRRRTGPEQGSNTRFTYSLPSSRSENAPNAGLADALKVSAAGEGSSAGRAVEFHGLSESRSSATAPVSNESTSDSNAKGSKETRSVSLNELGEMRRHLVDLMNDVEGRPPSMEGPGQRLARLKREGTIPRTVVQFMFTIIEARNAGEWDRNRLTPAQSAAVLAAWDAVKEWARSSGFDH